MKITLYDTTGNEDYYTIEIPDPTEEELNKIDRPDMEGQTTRTEVYIDRHIENLLRILKHYDYSYKCPEE